MEKPYNHNDSNVRELIKESRLEQPSIDFTDKVMLNIETIHAHRVASPLISVKGWLVLGFIFGLSSALLYYFPIDNGGLARNMSQPFLVLQTAIEAIEISKGMWYACVFLSLFLVQLPLLKRFLDKQRT